MWPRVVAGLPYRLGLHAFCEREGCSLHSLLLFWVVPMFDCGNCWGCQELACWLTIMLGQLVTRVNRLVTHIFEMYMWVTEDRGRVSLFTAFPPGFQCVAIFASCSQSCVCAA